MEVWDQSLLGHSAAEMVEAPPASKNRHFLPTSVSHSAADVHYSTGASGVMPPAKRVAMRLKSPPAAHEYMSFHGATLPSDK